MSQDIKTQEPLPLPSTPKGQEPSPAAARGVTADTRIPLSVPRQKHSAPNIPGYYTRWFMDTEARLAAAFQAGYEYVRKDEIAVNNHGIANDRGEVGGSDLGSRVTIVAGGTGEGGQAARQVLLKLRNEWRENDLAKKLEKSEDLVRALRAGRPPQDGGSPEHRYVNPGSLLSRRRPQG